MDLGRGWYRRGEVRDLVLQYYFVLRSVLRAQPGLRRCLTRCRQCGIFFLTDPRNAGRQDLRCPFGCREAHRKRSSTLRSVAYYQTEAGRLKKEIQNDRRGRNQSPAEDPRREATEFEPTMVRYVGMVVSLIEGRPVSREEIIQMLSRALRQHSMARRRRIDYVVGQVGEGPP